MNAIDTWITDVLQNRISAADQPVVGNINNLVAAWQLVNGALGGGPYLPLAGGTMTGQIVANAAGSAAVPSVIYGSGGFFPDTADTGVGLAIAGSQIGYFNISGIFAYGLAQSSTIQVQSNFSASIRSQRYTTDATAPSVSTDKARGTIAAPLVVATNDQLGAWTMRGYTGASFASGILFTGSVIDTAPGVGAMGSMLQLSIAPIAGVTRSTVLFAANQAGMASLQINDTLFTGGSATTTTPEFLQRSSGGAVAVSTWSTSGTYHGINADPGFAGNFADFHINGGASLFSVSAAGQVNSNGANIASAGVLIFGARSQLSSAADGNIALENNAGTAFGLLQFGGTTNAFPALKRSVATLQARLADDSAFTTISASGFITANGNFAFQANAAYSNGAGALAGTLTNSPVAGNPTKWIPVNDNGTTVHVPVW